MEELYAEVVKELSDPLDAFEEGMKKLLEMSLSKSYLKADCKSDFLEIPCNSILDVDSILEPFDSVVVTPTVSQQRKRLTPTEMLKAFNDGSIIQHVNINTIYILKDRLNYGMPTTSLVKDWKSNISLSFPSKMVYQCARLVENAVDFGALLGAAMLMDESITKEMCFLFGYSAGHFVRMTKEDGPCASTRNLLKTINIKHMEQQILNEKLCYFQKDPTCQGQVATTNSLW